jgi:hypothetical protein
LRTSNSVAISQYCKQQIERACRHKNENKFFRYKKSVATWNIETRFPI